MTKTSEFLLNLAAAGRYHFELAEFQGGLALSSAAARLALARLARQGSIASPARGFYLIIPPEYHRLGCLPADQFIPALMDRQRLKYYAGLLSAAQYHGAAHHRPQTFQVFLARNRRPIACGAVTVEFIARKRLAEVPVTQFNTPRGTIAVSTVEATAVDLVGYEQHAGGLDQVATILSEMAEQIDPARLVEAAKTAPLPWAQRLGHLLEIAGASDKTATLRDYVGHHARNLVWLSPGAPHKASPRDAAWKLHLNAAVEAET